MDAGLAVSLLAVAVSALSLALAVRADRRATRAERRGLDARPVVESRGSAAEPAGRRFDLRARNVGLGVARDVRLWIVSESGNVLAASSRERALTLAPEEEPVDVSLVVPDGALPPPPVAFAVWISWSDDLGDHDRRPTGLSVYT